MIKLNNKTSFLLGYLFVMVIFWAGMYVLDLKFLTINKIWSIGINLLPLFGGIFGLITARRWGFKNIVGKGLYYISFGLLSWSAGNWIWSYYTFFTNVSLPYPSWADAGYLGATFLWMIGMVYLSKATGIKNNLRKKIGRFYLVILPLVSFLFSYYLLVIVARDGSITSGGDWLKIFFDFAYPLGDVINVTIALLIFGPSLKFIEKGFKWPTVITLFGFILMFLADFSFSYNTTLGTYYEGHPNDLLFIAALFTISFGVANFFTHKKSALNSLVSSRALAKDAFKSLLTIVDSLIIEATVNLNLTSAVFLIRQTSTENFKSIYPLGGPALDININSPLAKFLTDHGKLVVKSEVQSKVVGQNLEKLGMEVADGIFSDQKLIGILLLGSKVDGPYSPQDLIYISSIIKSSSRELAQIVHYCDTQESIFRLKAPMAGQQGAVV